MVHFNNRTTKPLSLYETQWGAPRYNKTPSKVVSIPVHCVGSERNRTDSAMEIQRFARGYLVRKCLKKLLEMKVELEEIEKKVNNEETVMIMKKEQKERIRISETIMNLLLRLDSVRVFHCCALRELRKSLIRRAIFLQEFVDQIQMVGPTDNVEVGCEEEHEGVKKIEALVSEDNCVGEEVNCMKKEEGVCEVENEGGEKIEYSVNEEGKCVNEEENCLMKVEENEESVGTNLVEEGIEEDNVDVREEEGRNVIECEEEEDENREMLRRMLNENEKMMYMMTQLFERNEKQTSLLTSLTQRVEQLERAFTCDKLKKSKRRRHVDAKHRYNGCT